MHNENMLTLHFDYYVENKYDPDRMSIVEFVNDPRFEVQGLAARHPDGQTDFRTDVVAYLAELQAQYGDNFEQTRVLVHNAHLELYVLNKRYNVKPKDVLDTKMIAQEVYSKKYLSLTGDVQLQDIANVLGIYIANEENIFFALKQNQTLKSATVAKKSEQITELTYSVYCGLITQLSRPEVELHVMMHTMRLFSERSVQVDATELEKLIKDCEEQDRVQLEALGITRDDLKDKQRFAKVFGRALARTGRQIPMKGKKLRISKRNAEMQPYASDTDPVVRELARARLKQRPIDSTLARLRSLRKIVRSSKGNIPVYLNYCGAFTGRFSGGGGFNLQNIGTSGMGLMERQLIRPKPGNAFIIADYSQVEARILAELAGQNNLVEAFRQGNDIYSEFASIIFDCPVSKPEPGLDPAIGAKFSAMRHVGKKAILGLGYGMGAKRFLEELRADPVSASLFPCGILTPIKVFKIVESYRNQYWRIHNLWKDYEYSLRDAYEHYSGYTNHHVRFTRFDDMLLVGLPSERVIKYREILATHSDRNIEVLNEFGKLENRSLTGSTLVFGRKQKPLYGAKLTEHIVQGIARDVLVESILTLESDGLPVVLHIHDEVVVEVPEEEAEAASLRVKNILETPPTWLESCPLNVEMKISDRFGK